MHTSMHNHGRIMRHLTRRVRGASHVWLVALICLLAPASWPAQSAVAAPAQSAVAAPAQSMTARLGHATAAAATLTFTVNSTADAPDAHPGDGICADSSGQCTLRAAIQEADAQPSGRSITIDVPAGTYGLTLGMLQLTANTITISGALSSTTVITGNNMSTVMGISPTVQASLSQLTITGGNAGWGNGGGIYNQGVTVLNQSAVISNSAPHGNGGGIYDDTGAELTVASSTVGGNSAVYTGTTTGGGGGIYNVSGTLNVTNSIFSNNTSGGTYAVGGGIYNSSGTVTVSTSTFSGNSAYNSGGGIYSYSGTLSVNGSTFSNNVASYGGGIESGGTLMVTNSTFSGNGSVGIDNQGTATVSTSTFSNNSGGIENFGYPSAVMTVTASTFISNTAQYGGGIENYAYSTLNVSNSTFTGNSTFYGDGGAIYNNGVQMNVSNSTFTGNVASDRGGAISNDAYSVLNVSNSTLGGNSALYDSGGIENMGTATVSNSTLSDNVATGVSGGVSGSGGGITNYGTLSMSDSTLSGNVAVNTASGYVGSYGGGIYNYGAMTVTASTLSGNSATYGAGINNEGYAEVLRGIIVANSTGGPNCNWPVTTDQGYNLDSDGSCGFNRTTDISNTNPLLGPLANNGGPTQTMALLPGSPAIDHGGTHATGCPATDQRGRRRPDDALDHGTCDIGAFEAYGVPGQPPSLTVNPSSGVYQQSITLTGTNFAANETVNIYGDSTSHAPLYSPTTNAAGSFVLNTTADQGPYGRNTLIAVGQTSGFSATAPFTIVPSTSVQPTSSVQGGHAVLAGYGFAAHEQVATYWSTRGGAVLGILTTDAYGTFAGSGALTFTAPMSPTGSYALVSVGLSSGAVATSTFTIKPSLRIAPSSGAHGSTATVSGTGYGAHETVTVRWDCTGPTCRASTMLGSAHTDGRGNFTGLAVTIPATATVGTYPVGGLGTASGAFAQAYYTVTS